MRSPCKRAWVSVKAPRVPVQSGSMVGPWMSEGTALAMCGDVLQLEQQKSPESEAELTTPC